MVFLDVSSSSNVDDDTEAILELPPGFKFHPTDEEIVTHYLSKKILDSNFTARAIGQVDLNKCEPWDLPKKSKMGEKEWYFFCQRDRKYPTGMRTNRATEAGYWKATGKDKEIYKRRNNNCVLVGMKKTLVFYKGRAPKGDKTNWVMHEYRIDGNLLITKTNSHSAAKDDWVVCRVFHKTTGVKKTTPLISDHNCLLRMKSFVGDEDFLFDSSSLPSFNGGYNQLRPNYIFNNTSSSTSMPTSITCIHNNNNSYNVDGFHGSRMATHTSSTDDDRHADNNNFNIIGNNYTPYPQIPFPNNSLFSIQAASVNSGYLQHHQEIVIAPDNHQQTIILTNNAAAAAAYDSQISRRQCKLEQYSSNQSMLSMSQDTGGGLSTDISSSVVSKQHEMGDNNRPYYEDLEGPYSSSEGPVVDLECLWNY